MLDVSKSCGSRGKEDFRLFRNYQDCVCVVVAHRRDFSYISRFEREAQLARSPGLDLQQVPRSAFAYLQQRRTLLHEFAPHGDRLNPNLHN